MLADRKTSVKHKRVALQQMGGFILPLLATAIPIMDEQAGKKERLMALKSSRKMILLSPHVLCKLTQMQPAGGIREAANRDLDSQIREILEAKKLRNKTLCYNAIYVPSNKEKVKCSR